MDGIVFGVAEDRRAEDFFDDFFFAGFWVFFFDHFEEFAFFVDEARAGEGEVERFFGGGDSGAVGRVQRLDRRAGRGRGAG